MADPSGGGTRAATGQEIVVPIPYEQQVRVAGRSGLVPSVSGIAIEQSPRPENFMGRFGGGLVQERPPEPF